MYGCDRDMFQRVWQRVMPEEREDSPIELRKGNETSLAVTTAPTATLALSAADKREQDPLVENDVPCLGAGSATYGALLQEFITHELSDSKLYRMLAKRAGSSASRQVLSGIAADEYRHARRLSTAYFLISGVRFWPDCLPTVMITSFQGALRRRFADEQQGEAAYLTAAAESTDHCLQELYLELANDESDHARLIRCMLEQMRW
jgi:hypothetical protein